MGKRVLRLFERRIIIVMKIVMIMIVKMITTIITIVLTWRIIMTMITLTKMRIT